MDWFEKMRKIPILILLSLFHDTCGTPTSGKFVLYKHYRSCKKDVARLNSIVATRKIVLAAFSKMA